MKKIQIVLPRMSYEMTGFSYDNSRKLNTNNKNFAPSTTGNNNAFSAFNPVPYDFNFSLTIYVRNVEDGNQIIEQIVPYFAPDYTLKLNLVPDMGIIKNVPIVLDSVNQIIESDGDYGSEVRTVIWTLGFTVKAFIFGAVKDTKLIANTEINAISGYAGFGTIFSGFNPEGVCCEGNITKLFEMYPGGNGEYHKGEIVYQGQSLDYAYASGKVVDWGLDASSNANTIVLSEICGNFKLNQPIVGTDSYSIHLPKIDANSAVVLTISAKPDPITATANSYYTANLTIKSIG